MEQQPLPRTRSLKFVALTILVVYLCVVGLIAGATIAFVKEDHQHEIDRSKLELSGLARALEENLELSFAQTETVLDAIAQALSGRSGVSLSEPAVTVMTHEWLLKAPQIVDIWVTQTPSVKSGAVSSLDFGLPRQSENTHEWAIPLSMPILSADEYVLGHVHALIGTHFFEPLFREIQLEPDDTISIMNRDNVLLMHFPGDNAPIGRVYSANLSLDDPTGQAAQSVAATAFVDGKLSLIATRKLTRYPLLIQVSRPLGTVLRSYRVSTDHIVWGVALLSGLLGVLAWFVFEMVRQREKVRETLLRQAKTLELRVQQRTAELEASNKELLAFSYSISHDLRAPLRAINGFSRALLEDYAEQVDATGKNYLERIVKGSIRLGDLIDALLKLANVGRHPLECRELDVSALVNEVVEDLRPGTDSSHPLQIIIQPEMKAWADEALLRDVFGILIDNAMKFTRESPSAQIEIASREAGEHTLFWVRDNGVGFDMTYATRLFQPFQQLHTGQGYEGTGIGLASARRIIELHGGKIWAESAPNQGASVLFTLPQAAAGPDAQDSA
jgi:signal transduction histidine kinase